MAPCNHCCCTPPHHTTSSCLCFLQVLAQFRDAGQVVAFVEVAYESFAEHPSWANADQRTGFGQKQTA